MTGVDGSHPPAVAAGWHPDPAAPARERWWDGIGWTEFTRAAALPVDPGARRIPARESRVSPPDATTRELGWITWSPAWTVTAFMVLSFLSMTGAALLVPVAAVLSVLVLLLCAMRDRRQLFDRGFAVRPHLAWMALGPVGYLAARSRAVGVGGAELVVCIAQLALIGAGAFVYIAISEGLAAINELLYTEVP